MTHGSRTSLLYFAPHHGFPLPPGFAKVTGTPLAPGFPFPASAFLTCPHSSVIPQYRNLHLLSIGYDSRPRLRPRLTQSRSALLWKPWIFGHKDSHLILATHSGILSSCSPQLLTVLLHPTCNAPLPILSDPLVSVARFSPGHFRRRTSRPVSYYALFECVAASEPTSWLSTYLHIVFHLT